MKYILSFDIDKMNEVTLKKQFMSTQVSTKEKILKYMKSFSPCLFTSAPVIDIFTNEEIKAADNGYSDGEYTWYESEIYYFHKYNLKINDDFIEHVLNKI